MTGPATRPGAGLSTRLWSLVSFLIAPHVSALRVADRQRAQLLASLSLLLSTFLVLALASRLVPLVNTAALLAITAVAYALSRSKFHSIGSLVFCFGGVLLPYLWVMFGAVQNLEAAVLIAVPLFLILSSALLPRQRLLALGAIATLLTFTAPLYTPVALQGNAGRLGSLILFISVALYVASLHRDRIEAGQTWELEDLQRKLKQSRSPLEAQAQVELGELSDRAEELAARARDLETANLRLGQRASRLEAVSAVGRSIASVRELSTLLPEIATLIGKHFGFYHVGIFLLDEAGEYAVLRAANSEGGQQMIARKYRVRVGREGLVGMVSATGQARVALDVGADSAFLVNVELPGTRSEMALPLKSGEQIMGVLDAQSSEVNAFEEEDIQVLGLLADQVALAVENALLFEAAQRSLAEAESLSRQYLRAGWSRVGAQQRTVGYRYDMAGATPLSEPLKSLTGGNGSAEAQESGRVKVPIELRGEVIGELLVQGPPGKTWSGDELDLIKAVAERVALAAENARLFEETSRRAERERMVSEITSKIRSSNDPNEMIQMAVQELKNALGVSRVEVLPQRVSDESAP